MLGRLIVVVGRWVGYQGLLRRLWLVVGLRGCVGEGVVSRWVDRVCWGGCG